MKIALSINGKEIQAKTGITVLEVARKEEIYIPTLCDYPSIEPTGSCRICVVEVEGMRGLPTACTMPVTDGMIVRTESRRLRSIRMNILELLLSEHPYTCLVCDKRKRCDDWQGTIRKVGVTTGCQYCPKSGICDLQQLVEYLGLEEMSFPITYRSLPVEQEDPFFDRDYNLCVLCGRCVRVCNDVRLNGTLTFCHRGERTVVGTAFGKSHLDVECEFCGACVDICPTGALYEKRSKWEDCPDRTVLSVCPYCSVGCTLSFNLKGKNLINTTPYLNSTLNKGQICSRGRFGVVDSITHPKRIIQPMRKREGRWIETTWDEALDFVAEKFSNYHGDQFALIGSSQITNEDSYLLQKFARVAMRSGNILSSTGFTSNGVLDSFLETHKSSFLYANIDDIDQAKVIIVWGTDLSVSHPIVSLKVKQACHDGSILIVVDPRKTKLAQISDIHIQLKPGTDLQLIAYMMKAISNEMCLEQLSPSESKELKNVLKGLGSIDQSSIKNLTGIPKSPIEKLTQILIQNQSVLFLFGSGLVLQESARENFKALTNLASILSDSKILPVMGENNLMGTLEMGCHSLLLPGFQDIHDDEARKKVEGIWSISLNQKRRDSTEIIQGIEGGKYQCLYVIGDLPRLEGLEKAEFLVVQSMFMPEWGDNADVILPSAHINEVDGTVANFEGRIQRLRHIGKPAGESKPDWWICSQIAQRMDVSGFAYKKFSEIFDEIKSMISKYERITIQKIGKHGIHLRSYKKNYQEIERHFHKFSIDSKGEVVTKGYPYRLLIGRNLFNYRNGLLSNQAPGMERLLGRHVIEINPKDAKKLGISNGDPLRIRSKEGIDYKSRSLVTERVQPKMVYILLSPDDPGKLFTLKGNHAFVTIEKVNYE